MTTASFDIHIRTLECKRCGAPVATDQRGGEITCRYCGTVNVLPTRRAAAGAGVVRSLADEVARLSRLQAQLVNPISAHAYDMDQLPMGWRAGEVHKPAGMERATGEWRSARANPSAIAEEQRKLCWLTLALAEGHRRAGEPLKARAVLETALETLADDGHRQLVRCQLAVSAIDEGDLESAAGWLAECDPYPEVLELDSAYREAQAQLHARRGDAQALLNVVGARATDIPIAPEHARDVALLRVHGLELAGHAAEADAEVVRAAGDHGVVKLVESLRERGFAPQVCERSGKRWLEQKLSSLTGQRDMLPSNFFDAMLPSLTFLPVIAALLLVPIAVSRCVADADPMLGAYGYVLCPKVCEGCHGPARAVTAWHSTGGGEWSSDGADYYCPSDKNEVGEMSDEAIEEAGANLEPFRLSAVAVMGATYLMLLALLLLLMPFQAASRWGSSRAPLAEVNAEIEDVAGQLRVPPPPLREPHGASFRTGVVILLGAAAAAALLVGLGMAIG